MKVFSVAATCALVLSLAAPAFARDAYVIDNAKMFSAATVSSLNQQISDFNRQTGKEVVVDTEPALSGKTADVAAEDAFAREQVNGVLLFFAKAERQDRVLGDRASKAFFPRGSLQDIHSAMRGDLRTGNPDQAIKTGVNLVLDQYRSHTRALGGARNTTRRAPASSATSSFGGGMSLIFLGVILLVGFLIIRSIFRAMAGPRMTPPGYGQGPGYGQPGFGGGGYGGGGGGGSFFSGLLGGLGGAFLGNELFGGNRNMGDGGANTAGMAGDGSGTDSSGWQSDPGQADAGSMGGGGWGDSGGGFDSGGGGGGFDSGGGGGDGGW